MYLDRKLYSRVSYEGLFYIVCVKQESDFWNLCLRENHFVISAVTGKDSIIRCLKNIIKGYTPLELYRQLRKCEYLVSKEYLKKKEVEYLEKGVLNDDLVSSIVENTKVKKIPKVKTKKVNILPIKEKEIDTVEPEEKIKEERKQPTIKTTIKVIPKKIIKPIKL